MTYIEHSYAESELAYKEFLRPSLIQAIDLLQIQKDFKILDAAVARVLCLAILRTN